MANSKPLIIERFFSGLIDNRSPLTTPISYTGLNVIQRQDALIDGLNVELSSRHTLVRRPGFQDFALQQFAAGEIANGFYAAKISNILYSFVSTNQRVARFSFGSGITSFFTKATTAQTFFQQVGNRLYFSDGTSNKFWDGSTTKTSGIVAPTTAPTVAPSNQNNTFGWFPLMVITVAGTRVTTGWWLLDPNGNFQQDVAGTGTTGQEIPQFSVFFDSQVTDPKTGGGPVFWRNGSAYQRWTANTTYTNDGYGILDSNNKVQYVSTPGTTGATEPAWAAVLGNITADNTVTWTNAGVGGPIVAFYGYSYVYVFHTTAGQVSTASPASERTGPIVGAFSIALAGDMSPDTNCDTVDIYRTLDGGSVYYFLHSIANTFSGTWSYTDTTTDFGLNDQLIAPLNHLNDPPPTGMTLVAYYQGRLWGVVGNLLYFDAGPDCINGISNQSWPPANVFPFPGNITGLAPTSQGLLVFLSDQLWVILGGPQTLTYFSQWVLGTFGLLSSNCMKQDADTLYLYTTSRQFFTLTLGGKNEDGFNVAPTLEDNFDPATSYLALHRQGQDVGVFLSNGTDKIIRYDFNMSAWSPLAEPLQGAGALDSIQTTQGLLTSDPTVYSLLLATPTAQGFISRRRLGSFKDTQTFTNLQSYPADVTVGSLVLSPPGFPAVAVNSIVLQSLNIGGALAVGVRSNEISGPFVDIPLSNDDPWLLTGTPYVSQSVNTKEYQWAGVQTPLPQMTKHMQIRILLPDEDAENEILAMGIVPNAQ